MTSDLKGYPLHPCGCVLDARDWTFILWPPQQMIWIHPDERDAKITELLQRA